MNIIKIIQIICIILYINNCITVYLALFLSKVWSQPSSHGIVQSKWSSSSRQTTKPHLALLAWLWLARLFVVLDVVDVLFSLSHKLDQWCWFLICLQLGKPRQLPANLNLLWNLVWQRAHSSPFPIRRNRGTNQKRWGGLYTMTTALGF